MQDPAPPLLAAEDGPAFSVLAARGTEFVVVCDHASRSVPRALGSLGLDQRALQTHIACDIGALMVAERVAQLLDAPLVAARFSRLVIDCNRYPWDPASITGVSAGTPVPGNRALDASQRLARIAGIFLPYQRAVADQLDAIIALGKRPTLVSIHTCTPVLDGPARPWPVGLSYVPGSEYSRRCIRALRQLGTEPVGDNEPYTLEPGEDYTVPEQALRRGLDYLQVEFRQDLLDTQGSARAWGERLVEAMSMAAAPAPPSRTRWIPAWPCPHLAAPGPQLLVAPGNFA